MNRPPSPSYVLDIDEYADTLFTNGGWGVDRAQLAAMQEALTAEWLIEYGFMPDPSDAFLPWGERTYVPAEPWIYVDRDPAGKPSDYEVKDEPWSHRYCKKHRSFYHKLDNCEYCEVKR